jgi:hypothetical protein
MESFPHPPNGWRYSKETRLEEESRIWYPGTKAGNLDTPSARV